MRILHTVASLRPETGGPARSVPGLANALADQGLEVHVWSPEVPYDWAGSTKFVLHRGSLDDALAGAAGWDLIHDHGLWLPMNHRVAQAAAKRNIARIVSPRGMLEPWALNHRKWKKLAAWWLYQREDLQSVAALHATAASEARQFRNLGLKARIIELPNGVEIPAGMGEGIAKNGSEDRQRTALFLSRIHPKKGLLLLVDAWAKARPQNWRMIVAGPDEGGHRAAVEARVDQQGLSADWQFRDACESDSKWELLHDVDLFILPTYSENFGIVVAEALAAGTPVITTTGAPWQGLSEHGCGWWVEPDSEALAKALAQATILGRNELEEMGERGRRWVSTEFAWPGISRAMAQAYEKILTTVTR